MRIIIASSGVGGHFFAGLAIVESLKNKFQDREIFFLSSDSETAKKLIESAGFKFYKVYAKGLLGKNLWSVIQFLFGQVICLIQSAWLVLFIRPRLVIATGSFASVGVLWWSRVFGILSVIHEQNAVPGKANRLSTFLVNKILISFEESKQYFKGYNCIVTGMPVRFKHKLNKLDARIELALEPDKFTVLVMGGSRGAHRINQLVINMAEKLSVYKSKMQFIHLTGSRDYEFVKKAYKQYGFSACVDIFSTKMDAVYSSADLVISRSGSGSISEIGFFGLPAVLIPYPYSRDRHQLKNAQILADKSAAVVITENKVSCDKLIEILTEFINQPEKLKDMSCNSQALARPDAAERIVEEIEELINTKCKISNTKLAL